MYCILWKVEGKSNLSCRLGKSCLRKLHLTAGLKNDQQLIKVGGVESWVWESCPGRRREPWESPWSMEQPEVTETWKENSVLKRTYCKKSLVMRQGIQHTVFKIILEVIRCDKPHWTSVSPSIKWKKIMPLFQKCYKDKIIEHLQSLWHIVLPD